MPSVLVVDDSPVVRIAIVRRLRAAGLEVIERGSLAATADVEAGLLSCALLDYDLGDGVGTQVAERLRGEAPPLPIAFFTSTNEPAIDAAMNALGQVFDKPDQLEAALAWVLAHAR